MILRATVSPNSLTASRRFCTINEVIRDGLVSRINCDGPTGGRSLEVNSAFEVEKATIYRALIDSR